MNNTAGPGTVWTDPSTFPMTDWRSVREDGFL